MMFVCPGVGGIWYSGVIEEGDAEGDVTERDVRKEHASCGQPSSHDQVCIM